MDYKQAVEWLRSYKDLYQRLEFLNNKMEGVKAITYTDEAKGGAPGKTINDYLQEKEEIEKEMKLILDAINSIESLKLRYVLSYKFLEFMNIRQIAKRMNYSSKYVYKLYTRGIEKIIKVGEKREF